MKKVLIIIPCFNEEKSISEVYRSIIKYNNEKKTKYDVIVINDGSSDNSLEVLIKNNIPHLNLPINLGIGGAVQAGYKYAFRNNYDIAVQFDGDGQHDINSVYKIIKPILDNEADMVIGSRFIVKDKENFNTSFGRRLGIKIISLEIKMFTGKKIYDTTSGFRAVNRNIMKNFVKYYPYEYPEPITNLTIIKSSNRVKEVSAKMFERKTGVSSINFIKSIYYMLNIISSIFILGWRKQK